ncbi:MAG: leucine-rich repeat protein, partial [Lachnospiraceae bacterium]|nr:leucine-rich repeat protein [Lachnospiraceae bacterium]
MKKMTWNKRKLAFVLSFILAVMMMPVQAFADEDVPEALEPGAEETVETGEAETAEETEIPVSEESAGDDPIITVKLDNNSGMMLNIECTNATIALTREAASDGQFYWSSGNIGFKLSDDYYPENLPKKGEGYLFAGWEPVGVSGNSPYYDGVTSGTSFKAKWIGTNIGNWESQPYNGGVTITGIKISADLTDEIYIPKTINGTPVVDISKSFADFTHLKKIYLPEGISLERLPLFTNCSYLESICTVDWQGEKMIRKENCLPESIKKIEHNTFSGTALKSLEMPGVTEVEGGAFGAFESCKNLEAVSFGKEAAIDNGAFAKVPNTRIQPGFKKCVVSYPGPMSKIPWDAARYSPNVVFNCTDGSCGWCGDKYVEGRDLYESSCIHWKMDKSGNMTIDSFDDNITDPERENLFMIYRSAQVVKQGQWERDDVKTMKINHADSILENAFWKKDVVGNEIFYDSMTNVHTIEISSGLTSIQQSTFAGFSGLRKISLPDSLLQIRSSSFEGCSSLEDIYYNGTKEQWDNIDNTSNLDDYVPSTSILHCRCTVSFNANGHGNAPASQTNLWSNEDKAIDPGDLSDDDHIFTGWYRDQACNTKWNFNDKVPGDMILYAGWSPVTYPVTVNHGTGSGNFAFGTTVTVSADAAPSGQVFDTWTSNDV